VRLLLAAIYVNRRLRCCAGMMCRIFPAVQLQWAETNPEWLTMSDVIFDGIFLTVVTSDVCVAKLAKRELHPW
jgi:hypothetical protein